jgi:hypothetical protein
MIVKEEGFFALNVIAVGTGTSKLKPKGSTVKKKESIDKKQTVDTGMALVLVCLLLFFLWGKPQLLHVAAGLLIVSMTIPQVLKPLAFLWFKFSHLLGAVMSRVVLGIVYFILVCPIGFLRQLGKSSVSGRKEWKQSTKSVLVSKDHCFTVEDIIHPF